MFTLANNPTYQPAKQRNNATQSKNMAWSRRYGRYRRYHRPGYRRRYSRRLIRRHRRYGRRHRTSRSSLVKLTQELSFDWSAGTADAPTYRPFDFDVRNLPGFNDYATVYSQFRLLKAVLYVRTSSSYVREEVVSSSAATPATTMVAPQNDYLVVSSGPFASTSAPLNPAQQINPANTVPPQTEGSLRQSRWQKVRYPSKVTSKLVVPFKPYTMVADYGPTVYSNPSSPTPVVYQRKWGARRWMPFSWALTGQSALKFFGPYVIENTPQMRSPGIDAQTSSHYCTLVVYCQFKGQK